MDIASVIHNFFTDIASVIISGYGPGFYKTIGCKKKTMILFQSVHIINILFRITSNTFTYFYCQRALRQLEQVSPLKQNLFIHIVFLFNFVPLSCSPIWWKTSRHSSKSFSCFFLCLFFGRSLINRWELTTNHTNTYCPPTTGKTEVLDWLLNTLKYC